MPRRRANNAEREVAEELEQEGWDIITRGWPDFIAVKDGLVRFIEVKPAGGRKGLRPMQHRVAGILKRYGITVEVVRAKTKGYTRKRDLEVLEP